MNSRFELNGMTVGFDVTKDMQPSFLELAMWETQRRDRRRRETPWSMRLLQRLGFARPRDLEYTFTIVNRFGPLP